VDFLRVTLIDSVYRLKFRLCL